MTDRPYKAGRALGDMICEQCGNVSTLPLCYSCDNPAERITELEAANERLLTKVDVQETVIETLRALIRRMSDA